MIADDLAGWHRTLTATPQQDVAIAIWAAESVLPIWEKEFPVDDRPREAIEAAKSGNKERCEKASRNAYSAAHSELYPSEAAAASARAASHCAYTFRTTRGSSALATKQAAEDAVGWAFRATGRSEEWKKRFNEAVEKILSP